MAVKMMLHFYLHLFLPFLHYYSYTVNSSIFVFSLCHIIIQRCLQDVKSEKEILTFLASLWHQPRLKFNRRKSHTDSTDYLVFYSEPLTNVLYLKHASILPLIFFPLASLHSSLQSKLNNSTRKSLLLLPSPQFTYPMEISHSTWTSCQVVFPGVVIINLRCIILTS